MSRLEFNRRWLPARYKLCLAIITVAAIIMNISVLSAGNVYAAPTIMPSALPEAEVDVYYSTTLVAAPITGTANWQITGGSLPPGLSINSTTGVISGEPTTPGSYPFFVTVTDDDGPSSQQGFVISVTQEPLSFITTTLPDALEGSSYSEEIEVSGGTSPYNWEITSGSLPDGLTLRTNSGLVRGTPDEDTADSYTFTVEVTDSSTSPLSAQRSFTLAVEEGTFESVVSISSGLAAGEANVFVEGNWVAALEGGMSARLDLDLESSQTITVDETVTNPNNAGIRYVVEDESIEVSEDSPDAHFSYITEYYIEVITEPGQVGGVTGSGWYSAGELLTASVLEQVNRNKDTRYTFTHWQLPAGGSVESENISMTVTTAGRLVATYDTEYLLEFETDPAGIDEISGTGWYSEGYTLRTSAPDTIEEDNDIQYRFSYWELPTGEMMREENLDITVNNPGIITATYETYYLLSIMDPYGDIGGGTWHKAGSDAQWSVEEREVSMSGVMGMLGGKLAATDTGGTMVMNMPKTVNPVWRPDYTRPAIYISLIALAVGLGIYFAYRRSKAPRQAPTAAPQPQTTFFMIGDTSRPETTREKLLDKLSELLEKYEEEIKISVLTEKTKELEEGEPRGMLAIPGVVDAESMCNFRARKLLRVVTGKWMRSEARTGDKGKQSVSWKRDVYNEWEILNCFLPAGHTGNHQGNFRIVYTLLNSMTEEKTYAPGEEITYPSPHFTDGIPEVEITEEQVIPLNELPTEELP